MFVDLGGVEKRLSSEDPIFTVCRCSLKRSLSTVKVCLHERFVVNFVGRQLDCRRSDTQIDDVFTQRRSMTGQLQVT